MKYSRTFHVPWSESATSDDVWHKPPLTIFKDKQVVVSSKIDGENTGMTRDKCHARSLDSSDHPSRHWVKNFWGTFNYLIEPNWKLFGENVYAFHSVYYDQLPSYFLLFSIFDENNICLSWEETQDWAKLLGLETVPVLYEGIYDEQKIKSIQNNPFPTYEAKDIDKQELHFPEDFKECESEGYVIRNADRFHVDDFKNNTAKMVRKNHVKGNKFWMDRAPIPNRLKNA